MIKSVLVVDDNPIIRHALCEFFTREGNFNVCGAAKNGREAMQKAQQLKPDLIVTDVNASHEWLGRDARSEEVDG